MTASEATIRDYLVDHLDLIEPGLTLISPESYLPNPDGARGFIDIHCTDGNGRHAIIEIKRADGPAREAIQELYKYASLIRRNRQLREQEYRFILLSTTWHELLTPYAELMRRPPFDITAGKIIATAAGIVTSVEPVELPDPPAPRRFSNRHFLWFFTSEEACAEGLGQIADHMQQQEVKDFILLQIKLREARFSGQWIVYFAPLQRSMSEYMTLLQHRMDPDEFLEFLDLLEELPEPSDQLEQCSEYSWENRTHSIPGFRATEQAISYPERGAELTSEETASAVSVRRFGSLSTSELTDEKILREICSDGSLNADEMVGVDLRSIPAVEALRERIDDLLFHNDAWRHAVQDLLTWAVNTHQAMASVHIYNPDDILFSLACLVGGNPRYLPTVRVKIHDSDGAQQTFLGTVSWNHLRRPALQQVLSEHFEGSWMNYQLRQSFHELAGINDEISTSLGMEYKLYLATEEPNAPLRPVTVRGRSLSFGTPPDASLRAFLDENQQFLTDLFGQFKRNTHPFPPPLV
ncbi:MULTISPECIES: endonuclease NucS domain-containing protein [unclassified Luteococcus]|uniref:endonuclease NucS domain-containing protein n=1 Tax=unclassified Luteococcus TaxID=2639923 RepID=UPI00313DCB32